MAYRSLQRKHAGGKFKSESQRRFMWAVVPRAAKKWAHNRKTTDADWIPRPGARLSPATAAQLARLSGGEYKASKAKPKRKSSIARKAAGAAVAGAAAARPRPAAAATTAAAYKAKKQQAKAAQAKRRR